MKDNWPRIPYSEWRETCSALHLWTQVVGKYRLAHAPWVNHAWHATLYVNSRGLTTGPISDGARSITLSFDFCDHVLLVESDQCSRAEVPLEPMSVAEFFSRTRDAIAEVGGSPVPNGKPNELAEAIPFADDTAERPYDRDAVRRFHRALISVADVFGHFRTGFLGKVSPVHLFWGSFDLAVTRFSGRRAPLHPGGVPNLPDEVTREAYSHEVSSAGFWPGGLGADDATFYSYAYPAPTGFADWKVEPAEAYFDRNLGEFLLPYEAVRQSADPDQALLRFLQSTYRAAAETGGWNRAELECELGKPLLPRQI